MIRLFLALVVPSLLVGCGSDEGGDTASVDVEEKFYQKADDGSVTYTCTSNPQGGVVCCPTTSTDAPCIRQ